MTLLQKFIFAVAGLILVIIHSYFKRGRRLTLSFFIFAFITTIRKEVGSFINPEISEVVPPPFVLPEQYAPLFSVFHVIVGWVLIFYLGWCIAGKVMKRTRILQTRVLPTLLFAGIVVAAFSYAIEATAINIGWWRWVFFDDKFSQFLVGGIHFFAINAWFFVSMHFLIPYVIIECSTLRKYGWKAIFFLIPFCRTTTLLFLNSESSRIIYERAFFIIFVVLAFTLPLMLDSEVYKKKKAASLGFWEKLVDNIPLIVALLIVAVLVYANLVVINNPSLMVSIIPIFTILILMQKNIPQWIAYAVASVSIVVFGRTGIPAAVPVLLFTVVTFADSIASRK